MPAIAESSLPAIAESSLPAIAESSLPAIAESSLIVSWLRRIVRGSMLCTFIGLLVRPVLRIIPRVIGVMTRKLAPHNEAAALARVTAVIEGSRPFILVEGRLAAISAAWQHSAVGGLVRSGFHQVYILEPWQQVRLIGWMLFVAVLTHGLMVSFGNLAAGLVALIIWSGILILALGLMWGCRRVALAWRYRTDAKLWVR